MLLRTLRLDASDTVVFPAAAEADEVAVVGSFLFWDQDCATLAGKQAQAFRAGFLGLDSWGFATLAMVASAEPEQVAVAEALLAARLVQHLGAPDLATALPAAREELAFARSLAEGHAPGTVIAMHRDLHEGAIRERFRVLSRRAPEGAARDWSMQPVIGFVAADDEEQVPEQVDLARLARGAAP